MKPTLQPGVSFTRRVVVDNARTIGFMGEDGRVYGTPYMIMDIEETCRQLILQHADAGEDSVGIDVSVKHLAATLPNSRDRREGDRRRRPQGGARGSCQG